jgi:hypothetical protein
MPRGAKWLLGIVAFVIGIPILLGLSGWMYLAAVGCTGNGAAADHARELDDKTLLRLYREAEAMAAAERQGESLGFTVAGDALPVTARAIGARYAYVFGNDVLFNLSGCGDDRVFLSVTVGDAERSAEMTLSPGETEPDEVLWPKPGRGKPAH